MERKIVLFILLWSLEGVSSIELQSGIDFYKKQQFTRASIEFEKYIMNKPSHNNLYKAFVYKAESLRKSGAFEQAINDYEQIIINLKGNQNLKPKMLLGLAESYRGLGYDSKADRYLTQILLLYPDSKVSLRIKKYFPSLCKKIDWQVRDFSKLQNEEEIKGENQ